MVPAARPEAVCRKEKIVVGRIPQFEGSRAPLALERNAGFSPLRRPNDNGVWISCGRFGCAEGEAA